MLAIVVFTASFLASFLPDPSHSRQPDQHARAPTPASVASVVPSMISRIAISAARALNAFASLVAGSSAFSASPPTVVVGIARSRRIGTRGGR